LREKESKPVDFKGLNDVIMKTIDIIILSHLMVFFCFDGILMVENSDFPVQLRALRESMD
jgi:hypothetical protein